MSICRPLRYLCMILAVSLGALWSGVMAADGPAAMLADNANAMEAYLAAQANLPVIERSDWINVKTDVTPGAVGDGVADDTAAIQQALSMLENGKTNAHTIYFPPGTYRITSSLSVTKVQGGALYGHGRATVLVWDGPEGGRMFHSNGFGRNLYYGLTFDGRDKAAVGIDHASDNYYETRVRYQYCAFRNLTDSGIRVGNQQKTPSAEMMFYDCLFEHCGRGIAFLAFNDYDNAIARCIFRDCGSAVHCYRGNIYLRDSHFERSTEEDVFLSVHSHSIRRCTSVGSHAFIRPSQPGRFTQQVAVQDCYVSQWQDTAGAMQFANCGPVQVFDTVFAAPADAQSPAIRLTNNAAWTQTLLTANLKTNQVAKTVVSAQAGNRITDTPRMQPELLIEKYAANRWSHRPVLPGKIVDVKVDCGAKGDGIADDSAAIQQAIDAVAAFGQNAQAYLPAGKYRITRTLKLGPGQYSLAGQIARHTNLDWAGPADGVMVAAHNTDGATISQLFFNSPKGVTSTGILATADRAGALIIDGVFAGGSYQPEFRGTVLSHLPAGFKVSSSHLDGDLTIDHCGDAAILLDYWFCGYEAPLLVSGPTGNGFIGIHSAAASHCDPDLTVQDSASIVIGDFYTEQTLHSLLATGKPGQTPGRVTISYAKQAARQADIVRVDGYCGQITVSRANMIHRPGVNAEGKPVTVGEKAVRITDAQAVIPAVGGDKTVLFLMGNGHLLAAPSFDLKNTTLIQLGNVSYKTGDETGVPTMVPDTPDRDATTRAVNIALDHFRELSWMSFYGFDASRTMSMGH